ncbi:hypothetical protein Ndes2526B_g02877 [Nannochloris sp. 'desiccata']|nr:putative Tobamovirus multiplication protein 3 [Chlorella desiccata (nom. nud.)]
MRPISPQFQNLLLAATWGQWFREGKNVFDGLAVAYGLLAAVALVQIIRIQIRVPEYGWTTQKVFHLLNLLVSGLRATVFAFREPVQGLSALPRTILLDLPGLLFFSTYTLLVLFWAEIYYQARSLPVSSLRPGFVGINIVVYSTQVVLWLACSMATVPEHQQLAREVSGCFLALVSAAAAGGFLLYGGRLFLMLRRFPIESRGRRKKLREVGMVTSICATCFLFRSIIMAWSTFDQVHADLDVLGHPLLNLVYYGGAEVIPSALVLYILRKLPPKRTPQPEQEYEELPQE